MKLLAPIQRIFGYDAVESRGRRRPPRSNLQSADKTLPASSRRKLVATTRELQQNFAIAAWAIRKHLDYVSTFSFQCRSRNPVVDERIESLMTWYARPLNCDVAGRHSLQRMVRLLEERRTIDGDVALLKISDGRLQAIEGDRIQTPTAGLPANMKTDRFVQGIEVDDAGRALNYAICDRAPTGGFRFNRVVRARHILHHGYFNRFDQVRGISPLAAALNGFADIYEATEYALAKAKVAQLFGLKFKRAGDQSVGTEEEGSVSEPKPYTFNFAGGPQLLDLDEGDDAEFLESKTPSTEFAAYMQQMIAACLKALDIPYSFYNESFTNYSGARQALLQYEQSAANKRGDVQQLLNAITSWRVGLWIEDGVLELPAGMTISDIHWEWIPAGIPWIDPLKEVNADAAAIQAVLKSRQQICKSRGSDFFEVADQLAEEQAYLEAKGLGHLSPTVVPIAPEPPEPPEEPPVQEGRNAA